MYTKKQSSKSRAYLAYLVLGEFQLGNWVGMQVGDWVGMQVGDWVGMQVEDWVGTQVEDFVGFQLWSDKEDKHTLMHIYVSPESFEVKKAGSDKFLPALFLASHWYLPKSSFFVPVINSWLCGVFWFVNEFGLLMNVTLGLDCRADESLFLIHEILGLGRPVAVQLKVTLAPISMLWFRGTSTNSGARPIGKKYIAINIPFYYWDNLVWSQFHKQMTEERGNIFIITLLCHTRGWTAYTGTQKELFQANSSLPGCEPLPLLHSNYHHCFILFQKIILFSSSEEYVGFFSSTASPAPYLATTPVLSSPLY